MCFEEISILNLNGFKSNIKIDAFAISNVGSLQLILYENLSYAS